MITFTLTPTTPTSSTTNYRVNLDRDCTLKDFIDAVLAREEEWGKIKITKRNCAWYNFPTIEYHYGKIINRPNLPKEVYEYKVKSVNASGGWSGIYYYVSLIKEVR